MIECCKKCGFGGIGASRAIAGFRKFHIKQISDNADLDIFLCDSCTHSAVTYAIGLLGFIPEHGRDLRDSLHNINEKQEWLVNQERLGICINKDGKYEVYQHCDCCYGTVSMGDTFEEAVGKAMEVKS